MKHLFTSLFLLLFSSLTFGQVESDTSSGKKDTAKVSRATYEDLEDLERKKEELGIEQLTYIDSTFNYKVAIPDWFELRETGTPRLFGGTLPAVEGIENAIGIKCYEKSDISFDAFEEYIVKGMVVGQAANWSENHISMGKKELDEYNEIGTSYKVYLLLNNALYHCQYVLVETETAFLWIDFTATKKTFDKNKGKFDEFMNGFEIME